MVGLRDACMAVYHKLATSILCELEEAYPFESYAEGEMYLAQELGASQAGQRPCAR